MTVVFGKERTGLEVAGEEDDGGRGEEDAKEMGH